MNGREERTADEVLVRVLIVAARGRDSVGALERLPLIRAPFRGCSVSGSAGVPLVEAGVGTGPAGRLRVHRRCHLVGCAGAGARGARGGADYGGGGGRRVPCQHHAQGAVQLPSAPTVDVRAVRWANERWGIAGRFMMAIGSRAGKYAIVERRNPWYAQVVARRRVVQADRTEAHFGIGGGNVGLAGDGELLRRARAALQLRAALLGTGGVAVPGADGQAQRPRRSHAGRARGSAPGGAGGVAVLSRRWRTSLSPGGRSP